MLSSVLLVVAAGVSAITGSYVATHSGGRGGSPQTQTVAGAGRAGAIGAGVGNLARVSGIAAPFVILGAVLLVGPIIALFVTTTFTRELPAERRARERMGQRAGDSTV
jgi:hypothetical protein